MPFVFENPPDLGHTVVGGQSDAAVVSERLSYTAVSLAVLHIAVECELISTSSGSSTL